MLNEEKGSVREVIKSVVNICQPSKKAEVEIIQEIDNNVPKVIMIDHVCVLWISN